MPHDEAPPIPLSVNINQQTVAGGALTPYTSIFLKKITPPPRLLSDLRVALVNISPTLFPANATWQFLNDAGFPLAQETEEDITWLELTGGGRTPLGVFFPQAVGTTATATTPAVAAAPATPPPAILAIPSLPEDHKFEDLPGITSADGAGADAAGDGGDTKKAASGDTPPATNGDAPKAGGDAPKANGERDASPVPSNGDTPTNARTLTEAQLAELFDINSIFSGYLLTGGGDSCFCSNVFQQPPSLKPFIHVADASTVDTITTFSASSAALARQGFDSASLGLGTPWASGSISASKSRGTGVVTKDSHAYITGVYRFSRAVINLHPRHLKPLPEFTEDLEAALSWPDDDTKRTQMKEFFCQYGHAFAFSVELGGLLHSTTETDVSSASEQRKKEQDIKGALSVSVSAGAVPVANANAGAERARSNSANNDNSSNHGTILFEATGGDTLLASNPSEWTRTVMNYRNWRICKLSRMMLFTDVPGLFTPAQLAEIRRLQPKAEFGEHNKPRGPAKPIQGKWVQPESIQDDQGFGGLDRFVLYTPRRETLKSDAQAGGWFYLGQTTSATSALMIRQNPAWRPIGGDDPNSTPPELIPYSGQPSENHVGALVDDPDSMIDAAMDISNEDAPFCPIAKYDQLWDASTAFDPLAHDKKHMYSLWQPFPLDPGRFVPLSSAFSAHAPVQVPPKIDARAVCVNRKYLVKARLGDTVWAEHGPWTRHPALCASIIKRSILSSGGSATSSEGGEGIGIPTSTWQAIVGRKSDDFKGEVWLLDENFIDFVI